MPTFRYNFLVRFNSLYVFIIFNTVRDTFEKRAAIYLFPKYSSNLRTLLPFTINMKCYNNVLISNNAEWFLFVRFLVFRTAFHPWLLESNYLLHLSMPGPFALRGVETPKSHLDAPHKCLSEDQIKSIWRAEPVFSHAVMVSRLILCLLNGN